MNRLGIELSPIDAVALQRQPYLTVGLRLRGLQANRLGIELSPIESVALQRQPYLAVGLGLRGLVGPDLRIGARWLVYRFLLW